MPTSNDAPIKILIIAAEASSSLYAQRLLELWRDSGVRFEAFGIGSQDMESLGFECLGRSEDLAVVGLQEVLAHRHEILDAFSKVVRAAEERKPQIVLLMDYPDFNFRLARRLHGISNRSFKIVYYISPQIWAWRKGRVKIVKKYIDRMLVLFPFEPDFYRAHGVDVDFVGHPLLDELDRKSRSGEESRILRGRYGIADTQVVLGLMPGSRRSELKHHFTIQLETARLLAGQNSNLSILALVAPGLRNEDLQKYIPSDLGVPIKLIQGDPFEMVGLCDVVLVASGTATLVVGLMKKPMIIMYKMNALTVWIAQWIMKRPKFFGMANLILDHEVAPEYFQQEASPLKLAEALEPFVKSREKRQQKELELAEIRVKLGDKGATQRVSKILLEMASRERA